MQYFSETLVHYEHKISDVLAVGSDRDRSIDLGFTAPLSLARLLACTLHVKKNIVSKMSDLKISKKTQEMFLSEIFGDETMKLKGLIDSNSESEFDEKLFNMVEVWNIREKSDRKLTQNQETSFASYFVNRIADDMKRKMLRSVRQALWVANISPIKKCF